VVPAGSSSGKSGSTTPALTSWPAISESTIRRLSPRTLLSRTSVRARARAAIQAAIESEVSRKVLSRPTCLPTIADASRIGTMPRAATRRAAPRSPTVAARGQSAARRMPY